MMPEEYSMHEREVPEPAQFVDAPQTPAVAAPWVWTTNKIVIAALSVLALGFGVYFIMSYNGAKAAAIAEAATDATS